jgi:large subunit ribosomal protein L5
VVAEKNDSNETGAGADAGKADAAKAAKNAKAEAAKAKAKKAKEEAAAGAIKIAAEGQTKVSPSKTPRLQSLYKTKAIPAMMKEFQFANAMQVPRLSKVVINCAIKDAVSNPKVLDSALEELMTITGQKPVLTRSRKAIAAFKVREGNAVGVMVTLRRARMYEFLDRLMNVALPRVRDFKGVSAKAFDGRGNYSLGLREQIIFPEINYDKIDKIRGMTVTIETTANKNEHARSLLTELGMPFRK